MAAPQVGRDPVQQLVTVASHRRLQLIGTAGEFRIAGDGRQGERMDHPQFAVSPGGLIGGPTGRPQRGVGVVHTDDDEFTGSGHRGILSAAGRGDRRPADCRRTAFPVRKR